MANRVADIEREADRLTKTAEDIAHKGHQVYADDRLAYAAVAQAYATLALAAEVRSLRIALTEKEDT